MRMIKCDMCTELIGDLQLEVVRVGDRNYDLHKACAKKLKGMLKTRGEEVIEPFKLDPIWVIPQIVEKTYPYTPPYCPPTFPLPNTTPSYPWNQPYITCNSNGKRSCYLR